MLLLSPDDRVVFDDRRGMRSLLHILPPSPAGRAARRLLAERRRLLLCTGFPVGGRPETDGPAGTVVLARALGVLGHDIAVVSWPEALAVMVSSLGDLPCVPIPRGVRPPPVAGVPITIEVCGRAADGAYRNLHGRDVRADAPWFEETVGLHALVGIGDGGNEFGMGSAPAAWFEQHPVERPVSTCDVLVAGQVSNWAALAVVAALAVETGRDLLPGPDDYQRLLADLAAGGAVDGMTGVPQPTEDGFPLGTGPSVLAELRRWVAQAVGA
jgi:hypothetical protein